MYWLHPLDQGGNISIMWTFSWLHGSMGPIFPSWLSRQSEVSEANYHLVDPAWRPLLRREGRSRKWGLLAVALVEGLIKFGWVMWMYFTNCLMNVMAFLFICIEWQFSAAHVSFIEFLDFCASDCSLYVRVCGIWPLSPLQQTQIQRWWQLLWLQLWVPMHHSQSWLLLSAKLLATLRMSIFCHPWGIHHLILSGFKVHSFFYSFLSGCPFWQKLIHLHTVVILLWACLG